MSISFDAKKKLRVQLQNIEAADEIINTIESKVASVSGKTGVVILDKNDVQLNNVDNTTDLNKPISTATQAALNAKYNASNPAGYVNSLEASAAAPVQSVSGKIGNVNLEISDIDNLQNELNALETQISDIKIPNLATDPINPLPERAWVLSTFVPQTQIAHTIMQIGLCLEEEKNTLKYKTKSGRIVSVELT